MGPSHILRPASGTVLLTSSRVSHAGARSSTSPPLPYRRRHYAKPHGDGKSIVLEQPTQFNPPSHPARRGGWVMPRMYGPKMTEGERAAQEKQNYPGLMAPAGTWEHWFWHSSAVHMWLTLGTLAALAVSTLIINFKATSPFRHELPHNDLFWTNPAAYFGGWTRALRLHEQERNKKVIEMYQRSEDEATKRRQYMRAHGLEEEGVLARLGRKGRVEERKVEERKAEERKAEERKAEERKAEERKAEERKAEERKEAPIGSVKA